MVNFRIHGTIKNTFINVLTISNSILRLKLKI